MKQLSCACETIVVRLLSNCCADALITLNLAMLKRIEVGFTTLFVQYDACGRSDVGNIDAAIVVYICGIFVEWVRSVAQNI